MGELKISDAEWQVMEVIWQAGQATAADVIASLSKTDWNHRTIRTLLARLVEKGALATKTSGNRYIYRPVITRKRCVKQASKTFVEKVFAGDVNSLLAHFVRDAKISKEELVELRKLLDEKLDK